MIKKKTIPGKKSVGVWLWRSRTTTTKKKEFVGVGVGVKKNPLHYLNSMDTNL